MTSNLMPSASVTPSILSKSRNPNKFKQALHSQGLSTTSLQNLPSEYAAQGRQMNEGNTKSKGSSVERNQGLYLN